MGRQVLKALLTKKESRENELDVSAKVFPPHVSVTGVGKHRGSGLSYSARLLMAWRRRLHRY